MAFLLGMATGAALVIAALVAFGFATARRSLDSDYGP